MYQHTVLLMVANVP